MGLLSLFLLAIFRAISPLPAQAESNAWVRPWHDLPELARALETVPEGRKILSAARARDPDFLAKVKVGRASFTESTFSRTYNLLDGAERITLLHEVTINRELSLADATVDLAHELVHFTEKGMLDPYKPGFELRQFIRNGIEGSGGELSALAVECRVAWSLEAKHAGFPVHRLCRRYRQPGNAFNQEAARLDYYALGRWDGKTVEDLRRILPEVTDHAAIFTSSYAGKPYPVALAEEFAVTRDAACANNRRKYRLIAAQASGGRKPASSSLRQESLRLRDYERRFCRTVKESMEATSAQDE